MLNKTAFISLQPISGMLKKIILIFLMMGLSHLVYAQTENENTRFDKSKMFYGGNIGLQFGDITMVDISPFAGYRFFPIFSAGVGLTYQYYQNNMYPTSLKMDVYGGNVFTELYPFKFLILHAELGMLNYNVGKISTYGPNERQWIAYPLVGGGLNLAMGNQASFNILLLWNLNENEYSIYQNPIFRIGFNIGF